MSAMDAGWPAQEIVKRAAEACRAVRSYRVMETQFREAGANRSEEKEERIRVGSDEYRRRLEAGDPEEWLDFRGESYVRGPNDDWEGMTLVASASVPITGYTADSSFASSEDLDGGLFRIWDVAKIERLSDESLAPAGLSGSKK
jgi:hypothetical protein